MTHKQNPIAAALWMLSAGTAFALVNSLTQYVSFKLGLPSTMVAFIQYAIALIFIFPWLLHMGLSQSLKTKQIGWHILRVSLAVVGIQLWLWALAYPVPIWQGIALLMISPLFATIGSGLLLKENVGMARWAATLTGFIGAMIILAPWNEQFKLATLLPVGAAFFWAGYSLMVKKQSSTESPATIVVYLLLLIAPYNLMLALPDWQLPATATSWILLAFAGILTAFGQWGIAKAYAAADASFVQPFDHAKLPLNVLFGFLVFGWVPPGQLWLGAALIIGAVIFITHRERH